MARRKPCPAVRARRNDSTTSKKGKRAPKTSAAKRPRATPIPKGLAPGRVYDCNDPFIGSKVSGRDFSGTVLGCVVPPSGERGHRLAVGSSPRASTVKATKRARERRLFRATHGAGGFETGRRAPPPPLGWGPGGFEEGRRRAPAVVPPPPPPVTSTFGMPERWIDRVATAAASIFAYRVAEQTALFRREGLSEAAIANRMKHNSWNLEVGRDFTVIHITSGGYVVTPIHVDMKEIVGMAYQVNGRVSPRRGYAIGTIEFPSKSDEHSIYNYNWLPKNGRGVRWTNGETIPVVRATVDLPDPMAKIEALRDKAAQQKANARDPEMKPVRYWRPSSIPGASGIWSPEFNPLRPLTKQPTIYDTAELNKRIRAALTAAIAEGVLPEMEFTVVKTHRSSLTVTIRDVRGIDMVKPMPYGDTHGNHYEDTLEYKEFYRRVEAIINQWNFDNSDPQSDYFHRGYYENITDEQHRMEGRAANAIAFKRPLVDEMLTDSIRKNLEANWRNDLYVVVLQPGTHYRIMAGSFERKGYGRDEEYYFEPKLEPGDGTEEGDKWRAPLVSVDAYSPEEAQIAFAGVMRDREAKAAAKKTRTNDHARRNGRGGARKSGRTGSRTAAKRRR